MFSKCGFSKSISIFPTLYNGFGPTTGVLQDEYPYQRTKIIPLDRVRNVANFGPGIVIPLHPFFGSMGIAPPGDAKLNSAPPWIHAGNMDNKELVAGTTLYIPVRQPGALFEVGDGHAGMGNGEIDVTAMETSLTGTFQFIVHKGVSLRWPRAETRLPTSRWALMKTSTERRISPFMKCSISSLRKST
jgi:acetamidase/formamidase